MKVRSRWSGRRLWTRKSRPMLSTGRSQRPEEDQQAVLLLVQPSTHARHDCTIAEVLKHAGCPGRQGLGRQRSRHEADGRQHRLRPQELEDMGELDNTIVVFTTDNGAEVITFPDGGVTPFKGSKGDRPGKAACALPASSAGRVTSSRARFTRKCSRPMTGCPPSWKSPGSQR